jgi:hypothetical protein
MSISKQSSAGRLSLAICPALALLIAVFSILDAQAKSQILTETAVKRFVASYPEIKSAVQKYAAENGTKLASAQDHLTALVKIASDEAAVQTIDKAAKNHGFDGAKQWILVAESVGRAYAHVKMGGVKSKAERKLEKAIKKIEKNDLLSEGQKAKLIEALREGAGFVFEPPPPENVAIVQPMMSEIEAVMQ